MTMDSSRGDWKGITLKGYHYDSQEVAIPPMRDYMLVAYRGASTTMRRSNGGSWQSAKVGKGNISLLTRNEQSHWGWADPIQVMHIYVSQEDIQSTALKVFDRDPKSVEIDDQIAAVDPLILSCFEALANELRCGEVGQRLMIDALRSQIAVHLLRHYARIQLSSESGSAFSERQRRKIIDLIEDRLGENLSLNDLAESVGLSPFHFSRQFKSEFGVAPYAYVIRKRVAKAQEILLQGKTALKVVALECGFSDQSHLCRTFRKVVGVTPLEYQNNA